MFTLNNKYSKVLNNKAREYKYGLLSYDSLRMEIADYLAFQLDTRLTSSMNNLLYELGKAATNGKY